MIYISHLSYIFLCPWISIVTFYLYRLKKLFKKEMGLKKKYQRKCRKMLKTIKHTLDILISIVGYKMSPEVNRYLVLDTFLPVSPFSRRS